MFLMLSISASANDELSRQLVYRTAFGSADDVKILLEQNADANAKNDIGRSAIIIAAARNHPDSVKIINMLAERGADPSKTDSSGENAFTAAIESGTPESVEYLLQWKPKYTMQNGYGDDLTTLAQRRGKPAIIDSVQKLKQTQIDERVYHTSSRYRQKLFHDFAFKSCAEEYLIFYYSNEHEGKPSAEKYEEIMFRLAKEIQGVLAELKEYFDLSRSELGRMEQASRKSISYELVNMGSSNYRVRAGVGTNADLQKRCEKIATDISLRSNIKRKPAR